MARRRSGNIEINFGEFIGGGLQPVSEIIGSINFLGANKLSEEKANLIRQLLGTLKDSNPLLTHDEWAIVMGLACAFTPSKKSGGWWLETKGNMILYKTRPSYKDDKKPTNPEAGLDWENGFVTEVRCENVLDFLKCLERRTEVYMFQTPQNTVKMQAAFEFK